MRRAIGVSNQWPIPQVYASLGDTLVIHAFNGLENVTSLHFHGLFQNNTNYYDGAMGVTDCGISPGYSMTYKMEIKQTGSYWIHGHHAGQYPDGFRTALILTDPLDPVRLGYDDDYTLALNGIFQLTKIGTMMNGRFYGMNSFNLITEMALRHI